MSASSGTYPASSASIRRDDAARPLVGRSRSSCFSDCRPSSSTRRGRRFRASTTPSGPYLSPFYSPELFGASPHSWFGPKPARLAGVAAVLAGAAHPADPGLFRLTCYYYRGAYYKAFWADPPSCTVGEPRSTYRGENSFPLDPAERPSLHAVPLAGGARASWSSTCGRRCGSPTRRPGTASFGIGVGTLVLAANTVLLSGYLFGCHSMRHVAGGCVDQLSRAPLGVARLLVRELPQPPAHGVGVDAACSRWASPTCTSDCARWACGRTSGSSDARLPDPRTRRARHRRRRRGPARGDRGVGGRRVGRPRLQVAPRQGAHGDGRRRHRGRARQRRRSRQLEGPFRRHDARRPVREQLAHGGAARQGGARSRARARSVGRDVRSDARTAASSSATSAATAIRASRTSATAPASR